ncbi:MAG: hypothetical protein ACKO40_16535, partial [Planctomycetaceae bacterium]
AANGGKQDGERGKAGGKDAKRETVASDGTDDGEAMERILEHRKKAGEGREAEPSADGKQSQKPQQDGGPEKGRDGQQPQENGQAQQTPPCAGEDGKPCGKEGCSSCNGGSSAGGNSGAGEKAGGEKAGEAPADGEPGEQQGAVGAGGRVGGGDQQQGGAAGERRDQPLEWSEQDLSHARNAADMAIEHLRNAVASGDTEMLDDLGWTPEDARAFLARWERMRQAAKDGDPQAKGEFERAVKSLGLRPNRVGSSRDVPADVKGGQAEGRRSRPPSDYREQFRAFMQGTSAE